MDEIIVRPGIGALHGRVNAGFIAGEESVVIVDTMYSPADGRDIAAFVGKHTTAPVLAVVNTHQHADHTFGNQVFGAPVVASEACRKRMADNLQSSWSPAELRNFRQTLGERLEGLRIVLPSVTFASGLTLHVGKAAGSGAAAQDRRIDIRLTAGHTPGHSMVFVPDQGVLFGGDLFFVGRYPFVRQAHTPSWVAALEHIKRLGPEVLVPGHGPVCDAAETLRQCDHHISYFRETRGKCEDMLARGLGRDEILARAGEFPRFAAEGYERMHQLNVGVILDEVQSEAQAK